MGYVKKCNYILMLCENSQQGYVNPLSTSAAYMLQ